MVAWQHSQAHRQAFELTCAVRLLAAPHAAWYPAQHSIQYSARHAMAIHLLAAQRMHRVALRFLVAPSRAHRPSTPTCWMLARVPSRYLRRLRLAQRGTMRLTSRLQRCRRSSPDVYLSDSEAFSGKPLDELESPAESARDATKGMGSGRHSQVWYRSPVIQRGTLGIMMRFGVLRARRRRD